MPQPLNRFDVLRSNKVSRTFKKRHKIAPYIEVKEYNTVFTFNVDNYTSFNYYTGANSSDVFFGEDSPYQTFMLNQQTKGIYVNSFRRKIIYPVPLQLPDVDETLASLYDQDISIENIVVKDNDSILLSSYDNKIYNNNYFITVPIVLSNVVEYVEGSLPGTVVTIDGTTEEYARSFIGKTFTIFNSAHSLDNALFTIQTESGGTTSISNFNGDNPQNTIVNLPPNRSLFSGFGKQTRIKVVGLSARSADQSVTLPSGTQSFLLSTEYLNTTPCHDNFSRTWLQSIPNTVTESLSVRNDDLSINENSWWKQSGFDWNFTGVNVDTDGGATQHITLITPQMGLVAHHYDGGVDKLWTFRESDGTLRTARAKKITNIYAYDEIPGDSFTTDIAGLSGGRTDLSLVLLDTPVVSAGINIETYPVIDGEEREDHFISELTKIEGRKPQIVAFRENLNKFKGGCVVIGAMNAPIVTMTWDDSKDVSVPSFLTNVVAIPGDSGGPIFLIDKNNNLVSVSHYHVPTGGPSYAHNLVSKQLKREINAMNEWGAENLDNYSPSYPTFVGLSAFV